MHVANQPIWRQHADCSLMQKRLGTNTATDVDNKHGAVAAADDDACMTLIIHINWHATRPYHMTCDSMGLYPSGK